MAATRKQAGAQSATWFCTNADPAHTLTQTDWAALPAGPLKNLLNRAYLTEADDLDWSGFLEAFAAAGGSADPTIMVSNINTQLVWLLSDGAPGDAPKGTPKLNINTTAIYGVAVRVQVAYSASE